MFDLHMAIIQGAGHYVSMIVKKDARDSDSKSILTKGKQSLIRAE